MSKAHSRLTKRWLFISIVAILLIFVSIIPVNAKWLDSELKEDNKADDGDTGDFISKDGYEFEFEDPNGITLDEVYDYAKKELNGFKYGIFSLTVWAFDTPTQVITNTQDILRADFIISDEVESIVSHLSDAFLVMGRLLCCLYFLLSLMDAATRDSFTIESLIKSSAKLVIIFVIFSPDTINSLADFGTNLGNWVIDLALKGSQQAGYAEAKKYVDELKSSGLMAAIGTLLAKIGPSSAVMLGSVVAYFVAFGRAIEITVYEAMLPLAMGSIYDGGLRSPGFRYIKKWLALYLQGGVMVTILIVAHELSLAHWINPITQMGVALATASIISRSKNIANDVMGV